MVSVVALHMVLIHSTENSCLHGHRKILGVRYKGESPFLFVCFDIKVSQAKQIRARESPWFRICRDI